MCWTTPRPPVSLEGFGLILKQACPVLACPLAPLGQLGRQLRGQLAGQPLAGQLRDQLRFRLQVWDRLALQVWDRLALQVWERIKDQLQDQLGNKLSDRFWGRLQGQLRYMSGNPIQDQLGNQLDPWSEADTLKFYGCAFRITGRQPPARLEALAEAVASLGWWWPLRGAAVLTDRPTVLGRDGRGNLHAEHGPALAWADGYTLHALHGVPVPARLVEAPETITAVQIRNERNVEVCRFLLERYGHQRYLRNIRAKRMHADEFGVLWRCPMPDGEDLVLVQVTNATPEPDGSFRTYWLRVPPGMRTARQAVAWTFCLDEGDYHPAAQT